MMFAQKFAEEVNKKREELAVVWRENVENRLKEDFVEEWEAARNLMEQYKRADSEIERKNVGKALTEMAKRHGLMVYYSHVGF